MNKKFLIYLLVGAGCLIGRVLMASQDTMLESVTTWVMAQARQTVELGRPLSNHEKQLAIHAGVKHPERVRVLVVKTITTPDAPELMMLAAAGGLVSPKNAAQTLEYGIRMSEEGAGDDQLLYHELTHVAQYERLGLKGFVMEYYREIQEYGYDGAPLEQEARKAEKEFKRLNIL